MNDPSLRDLYQEVEETRGLAGAFYLLAMERWLLCFGGPSTTRG
ncbi:MAG: hypothetical protein WCA96_05140 [Methylocella sp.]